MEACAIIFSEQCGWDCLPFYGSEKPNVLKNKSNGRALHFKCRGQPFFWFL